MADCIHSGGGDACLRRPRFVRGWTALTLAVVAILVAGPTTAHAGILLAADSYVIGSDPTAGQYQVGPLRSQPANLTNLGFVPGPYFPGGTQTSQFAAASGGLNYAPLGESSATSGRVFFSAEPTDNAYRSVARSLAPITPVATTGNFFTSILLSQDGTATPGSNGNGNGFVLAGFGNTVTPALGGTVGNLAGLFVGFAEEGPSQSIDLIIRSRTTTAASATDTILVDGSQTSTTQTFAVITELSGNVINGNIDTVNYWVNPTDLSSTAAMTSTSLTSGAFNTYAFQSTSDFARMTYASENFNGNASFDGVRMATSLDALIPPALVPEPASLTLLTLGLAGSAWVAFRRRLRLA